MSTQVFNHLFLNVRRLWRRQLNPSEDTSFITSEIRRIIEEIENLGQDIFEREPLRVTFVNQLIRSRTATDVRVFEILKLLGLLEYPNVKFYVSTWLSQANSAYEPENLAELKAIFTLSDMR